MAQFDVYRNANSESAEEFPYLLDIQADLLGSLSTRVVVPLVRQEKNIQHLNPIFEINGESVVMLTQELSGIEQSALGEKVWSLKEQRSEIIAALDFLVSGF
ncbi:MAG: plasmid maintenance protein CcdB [Sulfuricurvum sp. GWF2_44_89]|uniref:Toxin CcdB n=1 Tax=Sulfuricurvum kujiense TaxID=148813 RepID=A0A2D3WH79_9BACT|nr:MULTISPECIES: CcdB family protein [Sulfuricurvum]OHD79454.1 MAG: plasmid maintenance protein CcdB [Sulfuricurvum sp. GWF2_44_89]OHD93347.1 MAG: plasmid maintenance protein CcdB [Sulfuricurvum sp. RIFOXYD12_FULL_44_77]OHD97490.1 MAG: plasmid maintenance protein CcdB [Sulfuricurvum sp. RIFOXYD2_FULL_44_160]DAB38087.1 MAG TPA: plasmid maintenance protein CcdB [Sulfuricurvum kujiense]